MSKPKDTEPFIDCQVCVVHSVQFSHHFEKDTCSRTCFGRDNYTGLTLNKNLDYWGYSNAPAWCPRRKANGGPL